MSEQISVCMATYNGEAYIKQQLASILEQLGKEDEVIVSDDSSNDDTLSIIGNFNDSRISVFPNQKFKNPIQNFEFALKKSTGDIIFLADQDDIWDLNKVNIILNTLKEYDLVVTDCLIIDGNDKVINNSFFKVNGSRSGLLKNIIKNSYLGCTLGFKRKVLEKSLPFPTNIPMHDWWIGLIGEAFFKVKFLNTPLMSYRRHGNNASPSGEKSKSSILDKINYRIPLISGLLSRLR